MAIKGAAKTQNKKTSIHPTRLCPGHGQWARLATFGQMIDSLLERQDKFFFFFFLQQQLYVPRCRFEACKEKKTETDTLKKLWSGLLCSIWNRMSWVCAVEGKPQTIKVLWSQMCYFKKGGGKSTVWTLIRLDSITDHCSSNRVMMKPQTAENTNNDWKQHTGLFWRQLLQGWSIVSIAYVRKDLKNPMWRRHPSNLRQPSTSLMRTGL